MDPTVADRLASVRAAYQAAADGYDRAIRPTFTGVARRLAGLVAPRPGDLGLDLATGSGVVAEALLSACPGLSLIGLDLSPDMIARLRDRVPRVIPVLGSAGHLPFADGTFDLVTCQFGLHHFPDPGSALGEARRVIRPGGRLGLAFWHDDRDLPAPVERAYVDVLGGLLEGTEDHASAAVQRPAGSDEPDAPPGPAGRPAPTGRPGRAGQIDPARDVVRVRDLAIAAGWRAEIGVVAERFRFPDAAGYVRWRTSFPGDAHRLSRLPEDRRSGVLRGLIDGLAARFPGPIEVVETVAFLRGDA